MILLKKRPYTQFFLSQTLHNRCAKRSKRPEISDALSTFTECNSTSQTYLKDTFKETPFYYFIDITYISLKI